MDKRNQRELAPEGTVDKQNIIIALINMNSLFPFTKKTIRTKLYLKLLVKASR